MIRPTLLFIFSAFFLSTPLKAEVLTESSLPSATSSQERTTLTASGLNGTYVAHDGPNCYNAVLVGKGYLNYIAYTDDSELRFYLSMFCKINRSTARPGDIMVDVLPEGFQHAALSQGHGLIFEKDSIAGQIGAYSPVGRWKDSAKPSIRTGLIQIRPIAQSLYFKAQGKGTQVYTCPDASVVKARMNQVRESESGRLITSLNMLLQKSVMERGPLHIYEDITLRRGVEELINLINRNGGRAQKDLYVVSAARSLQVYLFNLNEEQNGNDAWREMLNRLGVSVDAAVTRIQRNNPSAAQARFIFAGNSLDPIHWANP